MGLGTSFTLSFSTVIPIDLLITAGMLIFYLIIFPLASKKKFWSVFVEASAFNVTFALTMLLILSKQFVDDLSSGRLLDALIMARSVYPVGAHVSTYLMVSITALLLGWRLKSYAFGMLTAAWMVLVHEVLWYIFYYIRYFNELNWPLVLFGDGIFAIFILATFFVANKYGLIVRNLWLVTFGYVIFLSIWAVFGFPVTVGTDLLGQLTTWGETKYYYDFTVNLIEDLSWLVIAFSFVLAYWNWRPTKSIDDSNPRIPHERVEDSRGSRTSDGRGEDPRSGQVKIGVQQHDHASGKKISRHQQDNGPESPFYPERVDFHSQALNIQVWFKRYFFLTICGIFFNV